MHTGHPYCKEKYCIQRDQEHSAREKQIMEKQIIRSIKKFDTCIDQDLLICSLHLVLFGRLPQDQYAGNIARIYKLN